MKKKRKTRISKEQLREYKEKTKNNILLLTCIACKRKHTVKTNHPELYTEEVVKNYQCALCKNRKKEGK